MSEGRRHNAGELPTEGEPVVPTGAITGFEHDELDRFDRLVAASATAPPPLEADRVAALLGLLPDAEVQLDGPAFKLTAARRKILPNALAFALRERGWEVRASDVFRWQTGRTSDVHPALIRAIADTLGVDAAAITSSQASALDKLAITVVTTERFRDLAERLARVQRISIEMASSTLRSRMLATEHRGDHADQEQMLDSLEALVSAIESR